MNDHHWPVILAAGEGSRIRHFMTDAEGQTIPKQLWPINRRKAMLDWRIGRHGAMRVAIVVLTVLSIAPGCSATSTSNPENRAALELPSVPGDFRQVADQLSLAFENASDRVSPSVVPIFAEQVVKPSSTVGMPSDPLEQFFGEDFFRRFFPSRPEGRNETHRVQSLGSGVIVTADGHILTNSHVVAGADKLTVVLDDETRHEAKVIGTDPQSDVAVIKIDARGLQPAVLGDSDRLRVGQWVIAVGNPFQLLHTVTAGIVSATGRSSVGLAAYEDFIQTDASINPGNSGGALADLDGTVVGINTAISSPSGGNVGIGFAVPINMAKQVMEQLIDTGSVRRGYLALIPQDVDEELAQALDLKARDGALVAEVTPGGPADEAGIRTGDVILDFGGQKVENSVKLRHLVAAAPPGKKVDVVVLRDKRQETMRVTLGERPSEPAVSGPQAPAPETGAARLGIAFQDLTPELAKQLGYEGQQGALVSGVEPGGPVEEAGIRRGDLIKEVNREPVRSAAELKRALDMTKSGDVVALLVRREQAQLFAAVRVP